jgi:hypothetical protein
MGGNFSRKEALSCIRDNITRSGHHIYLVSGGATPRFAYTTGVHESIGVEAQDPPHSLAASQSCSRLSLTSSSNKTTLTQWFRRLRRNSRFAV